MTEPFVRVGVAVVVRRGGRLLMGLRRGSHGAGTWSVPGGSLQPGETVAQCAARELVEETGMVAELSDIDLLCCTNRVYAADSGQHFTTVYVLARVWPEEEPRVMEPDKCERWEWRDREDLRWRPLFEPFANILRERGTYAIWGPR
jgi:8-oxo-dGTP diphosphatase